MSMRLGVTLTIAALVLAVGWTVLVRGSGLLRRLGRQGKPGVVWLGCLGAGQLTAVGVSVGATLGELRRRRWMRVAMPRPAARMA